MIWLASITVCLLLTKVVLAMVLPSARRKADVDAFIATPHLLPHEGKWLGRSDVGTPVRVRVTHSDDLLRH